MLNIQTISKLSFAAQQNALPVITQLEISNETEENWQNLTLNFSSSPAFLLPRQWHIDAIAPNATLPISDLTLSIDIEKLVNLTESLSAEILWELKSGETLLETQRSHIEILSQNHWAGGSHFPQFLPAYSLPNEKTIQLLLRNTSEILSSANKPSGIDGYKSKNLSRIWDILSAIWTTVQNLQIRYALPPASFGQEGQKIRLPGDILASRLATCLDSTLLFTGLLEQAGFSPVIILFEEHALCGCWLDPSCPFSIIEEDPIRIRKFVQAEKLLLFESTLICSSENPVSLQEACKKANELMQDEEKFLMLIDIHQARLQGILPLSLEKNQLLAEPQATTPISDNANGFSPCPFSNNSIEPDDLDEIKLNESTDRISFWQRKLLDLTTRNRMLNLNLKSKGCLPLLCSNSAEFENELSRGTKFSLQAEPDKFLNEERKANNESLIGEFFKKKIILSPLNETLFKSQLTNILRKTRSDLREGGANTLFVAFGFVKWKKSSIDERTFHAPIILYPVQLDSPSAVSAVKMSALDDSPSFNKTLLELLWQNFQIKIPELENELPSDESGIDIERIFSLIRENIIDLPNFEVVSDIALSNFSFTKYLMWKDLTLQRNAISAHPLIQQLTNQENEQIAMQNVHFLKPQDLDSNVATKDIFTPLPSDSSQLAAIIASSQSGNFILDGPPGTGKSQTIANIIAQNLALGRRVLFVAEKYSALSVVSRRLKNQHLGEFCLELHSNKSNKLSIIHQLEEAWNSSQEFSPEKWEQKIQELQLLREKLNAVANELNTVYPNNWTIQQAIGLKIQGDRKFPNLPKFSLELHHLKNPIHFSKLESIITKLVLDFEATKNCSESFKLIGTTDWSLQWQENFATTIEELLKLYEENRQILDIILAETGLLPRFHRIGTLGIFAELLENLLKTNGQNFTFVCAENSEAKIKALAEVAQQISDLQPLIASLSTSYDIAKIPAIPIDSIQREWIMAAQSFWPFSWFSKRKVTKKLMVHAGIMNRPQNPEADISSLIKIQPILQRIQDLGSLLNDLPAWKGLSSIPSELKGIHDLARQIQQCCSSLADSEKTHTELIQSLLSFLTNKSSLLVPESNFAQNCAAFRILRDAIDVKFTNFVELIKLPDSEHCDIELFAQKITDLSQNIPLTKQWCASLTTLHDCKEFNLCEFKKALDEGTIEPSELAEAFRCAYARQFSALAIDQIPDLRNFISQYHEQDINVYQTLINEISQLTSDLIRARICAKIPSIHETYPRKSPFGILRHEMQKKRAHLPFRELAQKVGPELFLLAPCLLMSPISIAQYLPIDLEPFDLVIFDEASQIFPWDAIGSIARGKQVIIAGDPKQMPPTNFFSRNTNSEEDDYENEDMESILEECLACGIARQPLSCHYRSKHESLIAFSNANYYQNSLTTFPSPVTIKSKVSLRRIDGIYSRTKSKENPYPRTNLIEAKSVVSEVISRIERPEATPETVSIAIITLNSEQQKLIEDLFDEEREKNPALHAFFSDDLIEPIIVKNLETIQGDERDLILLSIGYGPLEQGSKKMSMNFGPLNRNGGWRRLNVAASRAREEMILFCSFDSSMLDLSRTSAQAVKDLKSLLEFAQNGPSMLKFSAEQTKNDLSFETEVATALSKRGWKVIPQLGISNYKLDLVVIDPNNSERFLCAIECDGNNYVSAATCRDREKVRPEILSLLGWKHFRVWSLDWWSDPKSAADNLSNRLHQLVQETHKINPEISQSIEQSNS